MRDTDILTMQERFEIIRVFESEIRDLGPSNFLYCDGDTIFVHADRPLQSDESIVLQGFGYANKRAREAANWSAVVE
jgi:hypothetical protein